MKKPLWQMTGEEYVALHTYACTLYNGEGVRKAVTCCKGVHELAEFCCCSQSQIYKLLRERVLDEAIISRIGKQIVFAGETARNLAQAYLNDSRRKIQNKKSNA
ncbi:MAG: DUF3853 family protein [Bacteroidales bacterium]|nr:DUF3853 family protein [Bacteroidales bacterium]